MLIDAIKDTKIDMRGYSSLPRVNINVSKRFKAGEVEILFEKCPGTTSGEDLVFIPYTLIALYKGDVKAVVSVEQNDLRSLSSHLGLSLKELQSEYGVKGFYDKGEVYVYGRDERECYGPINEEEEAFILPFLMDILLDVIDSGDDPVLLD